MVLDKEMAQFFMKDMTTVVQRVQYVAGEYKFLHYNNNKISKIIIIN